MKASLLYRVAAVLLLLFVVGHTLGFRQSDPKWGVDALLGSMQSTHCRRFLPVRGDTSLAARRPSAGDFGAHARHCLGVRPVLCRYHGCELEIPLYATYRFLNGDYAVPDFGGVAFIAVGISDGSV